MRVDDDRLAKMGDGTGRHRTRGSEQGELSEESCQGREAQVTHLAPQAELDFNRIRSTYLLTYLYLAFHDIADRGKGASVSRLLWENSPVPERALKR